MTDGTEVGPIVWPAPVTVYGPKGERIDVWPPLKQKVTHDGK